MKTGKQFYNINETFCFEFFLYNLPSTVFMYFDILYSFTVFILKKHTVYQTLLYSIFQKFDDLFDKSLTQLS